jgi:sulfoxide reductase catalytic subunit YedY
MSVDVISATDISVKIDREITPKQTWLRRREFLAAAGSALAGVATGGLNAVLGAAAALPIAKRMVTTTDPLTPLNVVTTYNNFYEFGSQKEDPARHAKAFKPAPWSVAVEGACGKPGVYTLEDVLKPHPLEERVYRHRCVEGWSCRGSDSRSAICSSASSLPPMRNSSSS